MPKLECQEIRISTPKPTPTPRFIRLAVRSAKQHKFQSFAVKNAVSFQSSRFDVFAEVAKLAVGKSRRLVGKSCRFKTLTYHRKHVNAKSASGQNSVRLLNKKTVLD